MTIASWQNIYLTLRLAGFRLVLHIQNFLIWNLSQWPLFKTVLMTPYINFHISILYKHRFGWIALLQGLLVYALWILDILIHEKSIFLCLAKHGRHSMPCITQTIMFSWELQLEVEKLYLQSLLCCGFSILSLIWRFARNLVILSIIMTAYGQSNEIKNCWTIYIDVLEGRLGSAPQQ